MKLSMHTLADNLTKYQPEINITEGRRVLQNARICTNENKISLSSVFLTEMSSGRILCANGKDTLILHSEDIFEVLNDILEIFDKYNDFEMKAEAMIEAGCSAEELLQEFAALTGLSFILADATFWAYATAFASEEFDKENYVQIIKNGSLLPLDALTEVNKLPFIRTKGIGPYHIDIPGSELVYTTTRNMFRGDSHVGWLVALKMLAATGQGELDLIDELGNIVEKMLLRDSDSTISLEKTSMFLDILEDRPVDLEKVIARLSSFGWYEDDRKVVYAMQYRSQKGEASHAIDSRIGSFTDNTFQMYFQDTMIL
ncbi:MAG: hypothetical protein HUJ75_00245, partial [Parasporobacterium sp.]|nr:hypothetical protein [Parasporobacterium sp.]